MVEAFTHMREEMVEPAFEIFIPTVQVLTLGKRFVEGFATCEMFDEFPDRTDGFGDALLLG